MKYLMLHPRINSEASGLLHYLLGCFRVEYLWFFACMHSSGDSGGISVY